MLYNIFYNNETTSKSGTFLFSLLNDLEMNYCWAASLATSSERKGKDIKISYKLIKTKQMLLLSKFDFLIGEEVQVQFIGSIKNLKLDYLFILLSIPFLIE